MESRIQDTAIATHGSDDFLQRFFARSLDLFCVVGTDGIIHHVNPAFRVTLGWEPFELISRPFLEFFHPDDQGRATRALADRAGSDSSHPSEYRWRCTNGEYRWLAWQASAADANGFIYAAARDVTMSRRTDSELRALHDYAAVGMTMTDPAGRFLKTNPAFCKMIGYSEAELSGMTAADITLPEDRADQVDYLRGMTAGEKGSHAVEKRYRQANGATMWARVVISAIRDASGNLEAFVAVVEDITDAKRNEDALRASDERFARMAANVPGMVYQSRREPDGRTSFAYVSDGAAEIYGVSAATLMADPRYVFDVVHPDDRPRFDASMASALAQRAPWRWAGRIIVNGEIKWIDGAAKPQSLPDGTTIWDGLLLDATAARHAAQRLEASENRYRSLFEFHPDAVFSLDTGGRFESANTMGELVSGYTPEEILGKPFESLVAPDQRDKAVSLFNQSMAGLATSRDLAFENKSGRRVEVNVTGVPVVVDGEIVGVFGIARDLTKQRELEAQLRHAQKMEAVGQLAAGVAHDFNNVLTVIQGCSEFLIESLPDGDARRVDVDTIRDAATRASMLTRQLLAFSRKQVLQITAVDLNACLLELKRILCRMVGDEIVVVMDLADEIDLIAADMSQLEQVIVNMAVNARDAMSDGGEIRFSTQSCVVDDAFVRSHPDATAGPYVLLSITDNGCGMDDVTRLRVFEPFFTTKETGKGTGLGLPTAYGIIRQFGGYIDVSSQLREGTTFDIYLPVLKPVATAKPAALQ
ncbi:MAG: PAS domain S-box protein [Gemmatimonadaceae bacterium]